MEVKFFLYFYFVENDEPAHVENVQEIIANLREEYNNELAKVDDQFNKFVYEAECKFKNSYLKDNPGIQLMEERFKLDMYNLINSVLLPRK